MRSARFAARWSRIRRHDAAIAVPTIIMDWDTEAQRLGRVFRRRGADAIHGAGGCGRLAHHYVQLTTQLAARFVYRITVLRRAAAALGRRMVQFFECPSRRRWNHSRSYAHIVKMDAGDMAGNAVNFFTAVLARARLRRAASSASARSGRVRSSAALRTAQRLNHATLTDTIVTFDTETHRRRRR